MLTFTIHIDGQAYGGEDIDSELDARPGFSNGWENRNPALGRNGILLGGEAYRIQSAANLRGHLTRIIDALKDRSLSATRIEIEVEG
jgi:hypothetical protein